METDIDLSEYEDPEIYDLENQDFEPDGSFLLDYARKLDGLALEVGCGTGSITIPLYSKITFPPDPMPPFRR